MEECKANKAPGPLARPSGPAAEAIERTRRTMEKDFERLHAELAAAGVQFVGTPRVVDPWQMRQSVLVQIYQIRVLLNSLAETLSDRSDIDGGVVAELASHLSAASASLDTASIVCRDFADQTEGA